MVLMSWSMLNSTAFDGLERRHGGDRLADRCRLIQHFVCGKRSGLDVCHSPGICPVNRKVMDYRDAEARHLVVSHHLLDREGIGSLTVGYLRGFNFCEHLPAEPSARVGNWALVLTVDVIPAAA